MDAECFLTLLTLNLGLRSSKTQDHIGTMAHGVHISSACTRRAFVPAVLAVIGVVVFTASAAPASSVVAFIIAGQYKAILNNADLPQVQHCQAWRGDERMWDERPKPFIRTTQIFQTKNSSSPCRRVKMEACWTPWPLLCRLIAGGGSAGSGVPDSGVTRVRAASKQARLDSVGVALSHHPSLHGSLRPMT